jgi:CRP/FNR family cyclic AMP-dependent transcriptional regulator
MKFTARDGSTARSLAVASNTVPRIVARTATGTSPIRESSQSDGMTPYSVPPTQLRPSSGSSSPIHPASARKRQQRPTTVTFSRGNLIFSPGNGEGLIYIVRGGCVRLYKTLPDGRTINLALLGPNTIFTQEDRSDGLASGATAEALVDSTLSIVEADDLAELIADSPELASAVIAGMTRRLTDLQTLVEHLLVRDTAVRLATTLLALSARFGNPTADGMAAIALPLTHQSLANMIGSNRVTVTRKLLELQEKGLVRSLGRNALAVAPDGLRAFAQTTRLELD